MLSAIKPKPYLEHISSSEEVTDLASIYEPSINLALWQRSLTAPVLSDVKQLIKHSRTFAGRGVMKPEEISSWLQNTLRTDEYSAFEADVVHLAEVFSDLFDLTHVGVRLELLDKTMCPRFHVDKLLARLITTYDGATTQWLTEDNVNRDKLGEGAMGLPDNESGIVLNQAEIQTANIGDVLIMKGEGWINSDVRGLVHRSPEASVDNKRLLLSFDFAEA
ncbi:MAG TPA: DUF1826 domain-containing protein [Methylophaga aminisulfidivorans]|uniref:DUF1826 domain-containing protein n=2 Tax=root TaxID=1 RepID=A0A7C1ZS58_9GAMM|nr:DUF1826 domain-containing protein [Methylophaga aminisulfidivorans]